MGVKIQKELKSVSTERTSIVACERIKDKTEDSGLVGRYAVQRVSTVTEFRRSIKSSSSSMAVSVPEHKGTIVTERDVSGAAQSNNPEEQDPQNKSNGNVECQN